MLSGSPSQQKKTGKQCWENLKHGSDVTLLFRTLPKVEMLLTGQLRRPSLSRILLAMNVELSIY